MGSLETNVADIQRETQQKVVLTQYAGKHVALLVDLTEIEPYELDALPVDQQPPIIEVADSAETPLDECDEKFFKEELGAGIAETAEAAVASLYLTWSARQTANKNSDPSSLDQSGFNAKMSQSASIPNVDSEDTRNYLRHVNKVKSNDPDIEKHQALLKKQDNSSKAA